MTFAAQNLISDPPFSKLDLISCRNVLIYFESEMQKRVIALFGYALNFGGYMFLGKSDGIAGHSELFETGSNKFRIYRRTSFSRSDVVQFPIAERQPPVPRLPDVAGRARVTNFAHVNQQVLLRHFGAAVVLVDRHGTIHHFFGDTGRYLDHPSGDANLNLLDMSREMVSMKLSSALREAAQGNPVVLERVPVKRGEMMKSVNVTVRPIDDRRDGEVMLAVIFEEPPAVPGQAAVVETTPPTGHDSAFADLVSELSSTKEELQASIEELETSNEELKAANEEVTAINEELQSTNEELETSKEELQSLNEELTTVNNQLQEKVDQLSDANSDLANLFSASDVATVFLDNEMRIRRFTPSIRTLLRLLPMDVGRPIGDISTT